MRLRNVRIAVRGRLPRQLVVALEHLRLVLDLVLLVLLHRQILPSLNGGKTDCQQRRLRLSLMRLIVTLAGVFAVLVLVLPAHP